MHPSDGTLGASATEALAEQVHPGHGAPRAIELDPRSAPLPLNIAESINESQPPCIQCKKFVYNLTV
jgi:hypothetical protein